MEVSSNAFFCWFWLYWPRLKVCNSVSPFCNDVNKHCGVCFTDCQLCTVCLFFNLAVFGFLLCVSVQCLNHSFCLTNQSFAAIAVFFTFLLLAQFIVMCCFYIKRKSLTHSRNLNKAHLVQKVMTNKKMEQGIKVDLVAWCIVSVCVCAFFSTRTPIKHKACKT